MSLEEESILLTEKYGSLGRQTYYVKPPDQNTIKIVSLNNSLKENVQYNIKNIFKEIFLPQGYPLSVSEDYSSYQLWDTAQAFCSTITGILATQSVMKGVGVGNVEATPLAATITWVIKDGTGHIGRIAFAWWKGTSLDANSKMWRLVADCLNDIAICLEISLPLFQDYTTYVLCLSTAMKAVVGVAGGATRAALTQHQAIRGNLADVAAKDGSQETAVNLIASMIAVVIISLINDNVWPVFFAFTAFHLISNYFAVRSVCLKIFNRTRFLCVINEYLQSDTILSPEFVNVNEYLFSNMKTTEKKLYDYKIEIGYSIKKFISKSNISSMELQNIIKTFKNLNYIITIDTNEKIFYVILNDTVTSEVILRSYFHAIIFATTLNYMNNRNTPFDTINYETLQSKNTFYDYLKTIRNEENENRQPSLLLYTNVNTYVSKTWENFSRNLGEKGWSLNRELLLADEWRGNWHV